MAVVAMESNCTQGCVVLPFVRMRHRVGTLEARVGGHTAWRAKMVGDARRDRTLNAPRHVELGIDNPASCEARRS